MGAVTNGSSTWANKEKSIIFKSVSWKTTKNVLLKEILLEGDILHVQRIWADGAALSSKPMYKQSDSSRL